MDNLSERITFKDTESKYVRINKKKEVALGLKNDEIMGKTDSEIFGDIHHKRALEEEKKY
ncbi:MAG: hypothetical protein HC905_10905 [Bacteroidales bacterium]|nr:hypothetical protein [Bacteroidales bacterium]